MNKEKIIEILEDYEFFVDDDFGGHYEHINCSQKALTPLGIVEILDYISELEQEVKKQQKVIDRLIELNQIINNSDYVYSQDEITTKNLDILKEVSE